MVDGGGASLCSSVLLSSCWGPGSGGQANRSGVLLVTGYWHLGCHGSRSVVAMRRVVRRCACGRRNCRQVGPPGQLGVQRGCRRVGPSGQRCVVVAPVGVGPLCVVLHRCVQVIPLC